MREEDKRQRMERWMKNNAGMSQLLSKNIMSMNPEVGFYIKVEGIEISQDFFKEEYEQITKSYFSVMKKISEYYKNSISKR